MWGWLIGELVLCWTAVVYSASVARRPGRVEDEAVASVIDIYNKQQDVPALFRRICAGNGYTSSQDDLTSPYQLKFTIKETVCLKSDDRNPEECAFKDGGLVGKCTAYLTTEVTTVSCETATAKKRLARLLQKRKANEMEEERKKSKRTPDPRCLPCIFDTITRKPQTSS